MTDYGLVLVTPAAAEPVTVAEAKAHCRVDISDDDTYLAALITAARQRAERELPAQLVTATWRLTLDGFPGSYGYAVTRGTHAIPVEPQFQAGGMGIGPAWDIILPRGPVQSITSILYVATDGTLTTLAADQYGLVPGVEPGRVRLAWNCVWPVARGDAGCVRVLYSAGYGAASAVPETIKQAIKLAVGHWYANRESVTEASMSELPMVWTWLLDPFRDGRYE